MRLYSIMKDFFEQATYLSVEYFTTKYGVSKRTIQKDISYLMRISPRKGFRLHMKRGEGYLLEVTNKVLLDDFLDTLNEGFFVPTKERPAQILSFLSIQDGFVSMDKIAEFLQVSKMIWKT